MQRKDGNLCPETQQTLCLGATLRAKLPTVAGIVLMRLDILIILAAALLALLVITRYMQHPELPASCVDHPTAPECHR
jgi:hypothetical protein